MKNITLSVEDAVYQAAPVLPAPESDQDNRDKLVRLLGECRLELGLTFWR